MFSWLTAAIAWLNDNPGKVPTSEATVYRLKNFFLIVGLVHSAFLFTTTVIVVTVAWLNIDGSFGYPRTMAVVFGVILAGFTSLGLYITAAYHFERLSVGSDHVEQRGCFLTRSLRYDEVTSANWSPRWPNGTIGGLLQLEGSGGKLNVYFCNFSKPDRAEMIATFLQRLPPEIQSGWEAYA